MTVIARCQLRNAAEVQGLLFGLAVASLSQFESGEVRQRLYSGKVRYRREAVAREQWHTALETLEKGFGDCEDLVAYRVAELWHAGEAGARPYVYVPRPGLMHCLVKRANGKTEDPSRILGMGKKIT